MRFFYLSYKQNLFGKLIEIRFYKTTTLYVYWLKSKVQQKKLIVHTHKKNQCMLCTLPSPQWETQHAVRAHQAGFGHPETLRNDQSTDKSSLDLSRHWNSRASHEHQWPDYFSVSCVRHSRPDLPWRDIPWLLDCIPPWFPGSVSHTHNPRTLLKYCTVFVDTTFSPMPLPAVSISSLTGLHR